jgi:O-antigen/teichoic acid export membrane protein
VWRRTPLQGRPAGGLRLGTARAANAYKRAFVGRLSSAAPGRGRNARVGSRLGERISNRHIARAFSQQLIFRALGMVASVLTVSATTRYLGPSSYGTLTTAVVFVGLWASLTELGIGSVLVRRVMSGIGSLERLVRINAGMSLVYCLPLVAIAAASGAAVYRDRTDVVAMVLIISSGLLLTTIATCFEPIFLATVRFGAVALSDLLSRVACLAGTIVLIHFHASVVWFATVQLAPPVVVLLIQGVAATRIVDWRPIFSLSESWGLLRESLPQTAALITAVLYYRADGVILSLRSTADEVGVYGLAFTLAFTLSVLIKFFQSSTLSTMTHLYARDRDQFATLISRSIESMLFAAAPIAIGGAILAEQVVELIGSNAFARHGGLTLALLLVAVALSFLAGVTSQALFAAHDQIFLMRLSISTLAINIVLNIVLVRDYGAIGAGIALVATEIIGLMFTSWRLRRRVPYRAPWLFAVRLIGPLAVCAGLAVCMRTFPVLVTIPAAAIAYLLVNVMIGPVTPQVIKATLSKQTEPKGSTEAPEISTERPFEDGR